MDEENFPDDEEQHDSEGDVERNANPVVRPPEIQNAPNLSFSSLEQLMVPDYIDDPPISPPSPGNEMQIDIREEDIQDPDDLNASFDMSEPDTSTPDGVDSDSNQRTQDLRAVRNFMFGEVSDNEEPVISLNHSNVVQRLRNVVYSLDSMRRISMRAGSRDILRFRHRTQNFAENSPEDEVEPENPVRFDTNLAAEHLYMGTNMDRVSGVNYIEPGQEQNLLLFLHAYILFPGEVLPFMTSNIVIETELCRDNQAFFGICFPFLRDNGKKEIMYGVTCQIYERGADERGRMLFKSRALQRFILNTNNIKGALQDITAFPQYKCYCNVKILPEIYLPEPLNCIQMGSLNRFRDLPKMQQSFRRLQAASTSLPAYIYEAYNMSGVIEKARTQLAEHKINTMPTDPVDLSYWLVRNLHLPEYVKKEIFKTDSVNVRMKLIATTFKEEPSFYICRFCSNQIADCKELFAMSKHGVQTQYCNSAGHIHQTNTVYRVVPNSVVFSGEASSEFSWFPGYQWHIIVCNGCGRHIGWQFKALEPSLVPNIFYGISSSSVRVGDSRDGRRDPHELYRAIIRLSRNELP
ncbi:protein cereblon-like isoform X1 [Teleopsis dalmanni]|uniref:protein cereblon-like isoform X1 n=1 Tax=Teleopsis dalmanni TaxID=139649 RepID=UPI000D32BC9F|nr:protein cereblon-like isoform X1 [Teleopsis dalmanni]